MIDQIGNAGIKLRTGPPRLHPQTQFYTLYPFIHKPSFGFPICDFLNWQCTRIGQTCNTGELLFGSPFPHSQSHFSLDINQFIHTIPSFGYMLRVLVIPHIGNAQLHIIGQTCNTEELLFKFQLPHSQSLVHCSSLDIFQFIHDIPSFGAKLAMHIRGQTCNAGNVPFGSPLPNSQSRAHCSSLDIF